jgi:hypothetical protein
MLAQVILPALHLHRALTAVQEQVHPIISVAVAVVRLAREVLIQPEPVLPIQLTAQVRLLELVVLAGQPLQVQQLALMEQLTEVMVGVAGLDIVQVEQVVPELSLLLTLILLKRQHLQT